MLASPVSQSHAKCYNVNQVSEIPDVSLKGRVMMDQKWLYEPNATNRDKSDGLDFFG